jgi:hypothetical protein
VKRLLSREEAGQAGRIPIFGGKAVAELTVAKVDGTTVATVDLAGRSKLVIGRSPNCDLILSSPSVSRHHAVIVEHGGRWIVIDAGSRTGVWIGDQRVPTATLTETTPLAIGRAYLWFSGLGAEAPPLPANKPGNGSLPYAMLRSEYIEACWRAHAPAPVARSA